MVWNPRFSLRQLATIGLTLLLIVGTVLPGQSAPPLQEQTSLKMIPADVAYYASWLRMGEQLDRVLQSKAFAKLKELPFVQMGWFMAQQQWENPQYPQVVQIKQMLQQDANKQLIKMLKDAHSHEIFMAGDASIGDTVQLMVEINAAVNEARIESIARGGTPSAGQIGKILAVLNQRADRLKVPNVVIGWKLTDSKPAETQLQRLDGQLTAMGAQVPILKQRYAKEKIGSVEYLTLRLDGSLVPWEQIPLDNAGDQADAVKQLFEKLKTMTLVISLGVRDNYLLMSLGSDNNLLSKLGGTPLLHDADELAPLRAKPDLAYTGIGYISTAMMKQLGSVNQQMDQVVAMVEQLVPMTQLGPEVQRELIKDLESVGDYVKSHAPIPAAVSGYSFMTPAGYEKYTYSWTTELPLDASQKLPILEHLGGTPLAFFAARGKASPKDYDMLAKVFSRAGYYAEKVLEQQIDADQQKALETLKGKLTPLIAQAAKVTREKLVPAMGDEQGAIVLDVKSTSKQWHVAMPESDQPLPMFELAVIQGVSDSAKLKEAFGDYFDILQQVLDTLHEVSTGELKDFFPDEIPEIKLARPQTHVAGDGTVYYYVLPQEVGLDAQIAPNAGLSDSILVTSLMPKFTARLLKTTPLECSGPLSDTDRPLAAASYFNFAGLIEAIEPWIGYGVNLAGGGQGGGPMAAMAQQVTDVLNIVKCFRDVSSVIYQEGGAMVTHTECRFEDMK